MRRREFITFAGGLAAAWPLGAHAEQTAMPVVGFLYSSTTESFREFMAGFNVCLAETGYVEGRNVAFEYRMADNAFERLPALAEDLVRDRVVVIVTASNVPPALAAKAATQTIPIVFMMGADPVENGLVADLARPSGNVTGITILAAEVTLKRLALLRELVPTAATIGYLVNPTNTSFSEALLKEQAEAARRLDARLLILNASSPSDIERAFATLVEQQAGALLVGPDTFFVGRRDQLVALAARYRLPTSYFRREFIEVGGLISYAASVNETSRQNGVYVGRILKGEKPRDLPVVQPTKFELVINLKTAKALGINVPATLLATADEVIE
jgi:putative tryptophan/tyrosine transport system substrate-binding protein